VSEYVPDFRFIRVMSPATFVSEANVASVNGKNDVPFGPCHAPPIFSVLLLVPSVVDPAFADVLTVIVVDVLAVTRPIIVVTLTPSA
jgi:hypothetical protein